MACTPNYVFHNWAQTITCKPDQFCRPKTEQEVQQLVQQALKDDKQDTYEQFRILRATWDTKGVFGNELIHRLFD